MEIIKENSMTVSGENIAVSIVLPVYNVARFLDKCISCLQSQTLKNIEMILVDDCGTDNSVEIIEKYAEKDNRIRLVFGDDYPTSDGTCIRDYVHLEDLSSAYILALEQEKLGAFNLGMGKGISVKEIVDACRKVTGHPIPIKMCPRRPGDPLALYASGNKARRVLGWNPKHSDVDTMVRDAWTAHQKFPNGYSEEK